MTTTSFTPASAVPVSAATATAVPATAVPAALGAVRGLVAVLAALAVLAVTVGCSRGGETTAPTIELAPTSTPITTAPGDVLAADTRPTEPETETAIAVHVAEIEAAVAAARQVQVEVLTDPSAPVERMETVVTGRALEATVENTLKARAEGQTFAGGFVGIPIETELLSDTEATHLGCGIDGLASFTPDGEVIVPADETAYLRRYGLVLVDGRWLVELVSFEGSERTPCEL